MAKQENSLVPSSQTPEKGIDLSGRKGLAHFERSAALAVDTAGSGAIDALKAAGFIESVNLKIGDPAKGNIALYLGELIGPGADIELKDEKGSMPTWQCHPVILQDGKLVVDYNQIHNVIASAQLDAGFKQAAQLAATTNKKVQIGAEWVAKGENREGQPLNVFRICSKTV